MMKAQVAGLAFCFGGLTVLGRSQTVTGTQVQAVSSSSSTGGVGGEIDSINTSKTANGTAYRWSVYNMTSGYGNSLQFWDYDTIGCTTGGMCNARFTFMDSCNVGIGTISPKALLDVVGPYSAAAPTLSSVPAFRVNGGGALSMWFGNYAYFSTWIQSIQDDGSNLIKGLALQPLSGNVGIGTTTPGVTLEVNGNVKLTNGSGISITFQGGTTQSTAYTGVTCGGDYAESVDVSGQRTGYEPGDVLVIASDEKGDVTKSTEAYSTAVVGIYSTRPGTVDRRQTTPKSPNEVPMAMIGIVPTKVSAENGLIHRGDLLVTSTTAGYAMKSTDRSRMLGAVIGKALGNLETGKGVIEIVVTLQ